MRLTILIAGILLALAVQVSAHGSTPTPSAIVAKYAVKLTTDTPIIEASQHFTLTLNIIDANTNAPVTNFDEVHTKLLHLIVVNEELGEFLHLHPDYQGDGRFVLKDVVLPQAANYVVFADFTPTGDTQQVVRNVLEVSGAQSAHAHLTVSAPEAIVGELKIHLDTTEGFTAGADTNLNFHVTNATTGEPVSDLEEYLGAAGHLVIIDPSNQIYIHTHPAGHDDMADMSGMETATPEMADMVMPTQYGPHLEFMAAFPTEGLWAMWLQVQYKGEIYTFPYVVEVTGAAETTPAAHNHG